MDKQDVVIVGARRTPVGSFQGAFTQVSAPELGSTAIRAVLDDSGVDAGDISEVFMGCVLPAYVGQAPARQASLGAGIPDSVPCTTINKVCGSGMKSTMLGHDLIKAGSADIVMAGGMESMTRAPYMLPKARDGFRMGHGEVIDHMFWDGLQNPYDEKLMGCFGDQVADEYGFTREEIDEYAAESVRRAMAAVESGAFKNEIAPVTIKTRKGETVVDTDEAPFRCMPEKLPKLKPAFRKDGTVTAANASSINDGAAAILVMSGEAAEKRGLKPLARIVGHATHAQAPEWFTTAPGKAIGKLLEKNGWSVDDVDLFEVNEAFASVAMAAMKDVGIPHDKINVNGGACALGHPIGATGARITVTLLHALLNRGLKRGVACLCIGGGEATAIGVEIL